ncbi:hypothetical protein G6F37_012171 [Rhizopus arrhizus]|nr:hypothetical protein G6F37_012171 [Rhizopus arrhizus]
MPMLHGSLTNHNPTSPSQEGPTSQSHGSNVHGPNALRSSSDLWKTFSAHARGFRGSKVTIFEDSNAKNAAHERRRAQLWIQSSELNSAVFDLAQMPITPASFFTALAAQYPDAIGAVPVRQGTTNGTVIAFDTEESRTKACTIGITIDRFTVIGTPTLKPESTIIRVSLEKLPLLRPQALTPMITSSLSKYGRVLDVGLYRDPVTQLFFGKGYVLLDTSTADGIQFLPLEHEIDLGQRRLVYASWRGMAKHCFYCHKPGHTKVDCPRLSNQKIKRCYSCDSIEHLFRDCPRRQTPATSSKRQRAEDVDLPLRTQDHNAVEQQLQSNSVTAADADIVAAQPQTNDNATILASTSNAQVDTDSQQTQEEPDDEDDSDYQPSTEEDDDSSMDECEDTDDITIDEDEVRQLQDESARDSTSSNVGLQRSGPANLDSSTTASLNCRGLKKILSSSGRSFSRTLRSLHFDILALQETHADSLDIQTRFDQCLQPSGCLWTKHCGLLSFNPAVSFDPLWSSLDGRVLVARVNHLSGLYAPLCIYVIYAPASRSERLSFFSNLDALLRYDQRPSDRCILLGDFNHNVHSRSDSPSLRPWQHWVRSFLHDPLRDDPVCRDLPTFRNISTIDFILCTEDLQHLLTLPSLTYVRGCDHSAISVSLSFGKSRVGPGLWRCNPFLAQDSFFRRELAAFCDNAAIFLPPGDAPKRWDTFKARLKAFIQGYSNKTQARHHCAQKSLQQQRSTMLRRRSNRSTIESLQQVEAQLDALQDRSASILMLRAGSRWRELGERSNAYFYRTLRSRQYQTSISSLQSSNGELVHEPSALTQCAQEYYEQLYSPDPIDCDAIESLLSNIPADVRVDPASMLKSNSHH